MPSQKYNIVVAHASKHTLRGVGLVSGYTTLGDLAELLLRVNISANLRTPEPNGVVFDILETLESSPDLYPLFSRGLTFSCCRADMVGKRDPSKPIYDMEIEFSDDSTHGLLDGGHNALALIYYILGTKPKKSTKTQKESAWHEGRRLLEAFLETEKSMPARLVPINFAYGPNDILQSMAVARNNSTKVSSAALAVGEGLFDAIKAKLVLDVRNNVRWKDNAPGTHTTPVDIATMFLVTLYALDEDHPIQKNILKGMPHHLYGDNTRILDRLEAIMEGYKDDPAVKSALSNLNRVISAYEMIQEKFPKLYNKQPSRHSDKNGTRKYGTLSAANSKQKAEKMFRGTPLDYVVPNYIVLPILYALIAGSATKSDTEVVIPKGAVLSKYFDEVFARGAMRAFVNIIDLNISNMKDKVAKKAYHYNSLRAFFEEDLKLFKRAENNEKGEN